MPFPAISKSPFFIPPQIVSERDSIVTRSAPSVRRKGRPDGVVHADITNQFAAFCRLQAQHGLTVGGGGIDAV